MPVAPHTTSITRASRTIAICRIVLAISSLFAIWLDPSEPRQYAALTYGLHIVYVGYSIVVATLVHVRPIPRVLPVTTHAFDIAVFSTLQYLTLGPSSPFFIYFVFSLFCGALRWGWRGTLATAAVVLVAFTVMGLAMVGSPGFELNRFLIRIVYLGLVAGLLVYLGRYEARLREEIERLARWPRTGDMTVQGALEQGLGHAARVVGANKAAMVWDAGDEPALQLAVWSPEGTALTTHAPGELLPLVDEELERSTFLYLAPDDAAEPVQLITQDGALTERSQAPVPDALRPSIAGRSVISAPFDTERVSGRVWLVNVGTPTAELFPLTEIVGRELAATLDQLYATQQLQRIAASEERIRLARDLHDGVLQSLTGVRLELRSLADVADISPAARDRLFALERALSMEQRELRLFITDLKPAAGAESDDALVRRLEALRERLTNEWHVPVTLTVSADGLQVPRAIEEALPLMVHEAVVNALKHAEPSRVSVAVEPAGGTLRVTVRDDGRGFTFKGRYDREDMLRMNMGPRSLIERVGALGGTVTVESTAAGSTVEMLLRVEET